MMGEIMSNIRDLFQTVLGLSLVGSYVVLLVLLARLVLCKAPKWCSYVLWGVVFIRLTCPVFPEGQFSLIPRQLQTSIEEVIQDFGITNRNTMLNISANENLHNNSMAAQEAQSPDFIQAEQNQAFQQAEQNSTIQQAEQNQVSQQAEQNSTTQQVEQNQASQQAEQNLASQSAQKNQSMQQTEQNLATQQTQRNQTKLNQSSQQTGQNAAGMTLQESNLLWQTTVTQVINVLSVIWLLGTILLAGYHIISYWQLKARVRNAILAEQGVYEVQGEHLSFVMGVFKPAIYLSAGLDVESRKVILCHERVHLRRRDYLTKPLALGVCCIHWFNPLVWLAFYLMSKDCEMSCDEKVVSILGEESKKVYSYTLLDEATRGERRKYKRDSVCALLSFGEDSVKTRISHVLKYKKASAWIVVGAVVVLVVLIVGLCSNQSRELLTEQGVVQKVLEEGGYAGDSETVCFLRDYEGDNRPEAFVEIGEKIVDEQRMDGDLWFVSEEGEVTLLLENKFFDVEHEFFTAPNEEFILVSYVEGNPTLTEVYGVRENKPERMIGGTEEKYIENDTIVCVQGDYKLAYDVAMQSFSGHGQKTYAYYYEAPYFKEYSGHELSREELVNGYGNGAEILAELEKLFPEGHFQYIARENGLLHVNVAYEKGNYDNVIHFWNVTYEHNTADGANELVALGSEDGCYKRNMQAAGEVSFAEEIAKEYGWQSDNPLVTSMMTPEAALDTFAFAYQERNGNILYQLSHDKDNFENWDKVIPLADGSYGFGDSSPWVSHYSIDYLAGQEEATIRFYLENSIPEIYIAEETVRLVKDGVFYYVDHVNYVEYSSIDTREEAKQVYDLEKEDYLNNPFGSESTGYAWRYTWRIFKHILEGTNPEYYNRYTDPVTAAKAYLHLGEGSGEVTEIKYSTRPQILHSSGYGEGTIVNVRYTFAEDGSTMDIPMTLAEESKGVWALCFSTEQMIAEQATEKIGGATWENKTIIWSSNARVIYNVCTPDDKEYPVYQVSSYGLYRNDERGLTCILPYHMPASTKIEYYNGKLYFPTDSQYQDEALDWMDDSVCVLDPETGETQLLALPENVQRMFPLDWFAISDGFMVFSSMDTNDTCEILLEDLEPVWAGKRIEELSDAERNEYGVYNRQLILENANTIYELGITSTNKIAALIDMDGDGITEEISIVPNSNTQYSVGLLDDYTLNAGEGVEHRTAEQLTGYIWAFSPDGEQIYIALYEDGPSGDPFTTIFKYEDNRLREAGSFDNDIRFVLLEDGIISTWSRDWVVQTDNIAVQYRFDEAGNLERIPQETYKYLLAESTDFPQPRLLVDLPLHTAPESEETFILTPQTVRFLEVHHSGNWVLVEGEDGRQGWMQIESSIIIELDMYTMEVFEGLNMAG